MRSGRDFLVVSNNPLAIQILQEHYQFHAMVDANYREVLLYVRNQLHLGHQLYTHPLSGSVKPNETPYKSVVISQKRGVVMGEQVEVISNALQAYDKFAPRDRIYEQSAIEDFQLIDYTLLAGALEFDAVAGLNRQSRVNESSTKILI